MGTEVAGEYRLPLVLESQLHKKHDGQSGGGCRRLHRNRYSLHPMETHCLVGDINLWEGYPVSRVFAVPLYFSYDCCSGINGPQEVRPVVRSSMAFSRCVPSIAAGVGYTARSKSRALSSSTEMCADFETPVEIPRE